MAEGFEQYHVPNQTRRDKLIVNNNPPFCLHNNTNAAALLPLYDPSDLIHQSFNLDAIHMVTPSSSSSNHMYYLNPQLSVQSNPNYNVQDIPNSQTLCLSLSSYPLQMNLQRYAFVVKGSRFLKPAQVLLEEICDVVMGIYLEKNTANDLSVMESYLLMENLTGNYGREQNGKKLRLISMLDEVYKRYEQHYQQIQAVITSFESISGLSSRAPLANMALKALSKHFICLKDAISDQLQFTMKSKDKTAYSKLELNSGRAAYGQRQITGDAQHVWKPQRGLPERAVNVLRAWLFEHFLHPYPTDTDKLMLAKQTGLSRNQVSNWFINARVRLWKPMVEEIHMLETYHAQKGEQQNDHLATKSPFEEFPLNRNREDLTETPLPYDDFLHNPNSGVGVSNTSGVSLTLGLHQNGVGLSESYTINAARRFGLETEQNGQFGRDIIRGQVPRDFVW